MTPHVRPDWLTTYALERQPQSPRLEPHETTTRALPVAAMLVELLRRLARPCRRP